MVVDRMDGAPPLSARLAPAKASSVALFHRDGDELMRLQQAWPALFGQLDQVPARPSSRVPVLGCSGAAMPSLGRSLSVGAMHPDRTTPALRLGMPRSRPQRRHSRYP
jgi:hypothetical protein